MNLFKLTYLATDHAVLIDVLNTQHALLVARDERRRTGGDIEVQLFDDIRGDYLTTTYTSAPCGTRPAGLEIVRWYEMPSHRQLRVQDGDYTYTQDTGVTL